MGWRKCFGSLYLGGKGVEEVFWRFVSRGKWGGGSILEVCSKVEEMGWIICFAGFNKEVNWMFWRFLDRGGILDVI